MLDARKGHTALPRLGVQGAQVKGERAQALGSGSPACREQQGLTPAQSPSLQGDAHGRRMHLLEAQQKVEGMQSSLRRACEP